MALITDEGFEMTMEQETEDGELETELTPAGVEVDYAPNELHTYWG